VNDAHFTCDLAAASTPLPHFWEHTVGSDYAAMALRADWRSQLARAQAELGFGYVRFHDVLSDRMFTLTCQQDRLLYSFFNADSIFDFLRSIGMRPFVELSFMPRTLASGDTTVFSYQGNVTPPKDYAQWARLVSKLVLHLVERYGVEEVRRWYFEVWNEPNLEAFWTGTQAEYFELYRRTVGAIKGVDDKLRVGGPATVMNAWISAFLDFCEGNSLPVDFISTHHYPTDAFGKPGDDTETQLAQSRRSVLREQAKATRQQARGKPVFYTEWNSSSNPRDALHDEPYGAAFAVKTVMEANGLVHGYSYWTFSDIFEENYLPSIPFHGGFGLLNLQGIPKPTYRAFQLLHGIGNELLPIQGAHETVDAWVVRGETAVSVLFTNHALPRHPIGPSNPRSALPSRRQPRLLRRRPRAPATPSKPLHCWHWARNWPARGKGQRPSRSTRKRSSSIL
jgi:xylan 1,4-beta-xylosidase